MLKISISVFLRFSGAASKLVLLLYLAKFSTTELLGQYGLIVALVAVFSQIIGLDVHYFNSRIISSEAKGVVSRTIRSQLLLHIFCYVIFFPFLLLFSYTNLFELNLLVYIYFIIAFEHLSMEVVRFLMFVLRPNLSALILFIRSTIYVVIFIFITYTDMNNLTLENLLILWLLSNIFGFIFGIIFIRDFIFLKGIGIENTKEYYIELIKKSFPFLIASTFFILIQNLDRFVLKGFEGDYFVGILFFFASIANALYLFVNYTVSVFHGPIAIKKFRKFGLNEYMLEKKLMIKKTIIATIVGALLALLLIQPFLEILGRNEYFSYLNIFYIFLLSQALMCASDFFQLDLYVRNMDKEIMYSSLLSGLLTFIIQVILVFLYGIYGAVTATLLGVIILTYFRYYFFKNSIKKYSEF